jgi:hypothetical protein
MVALRALRYTGALLVGVAAAMHLYLYFDYFHRVATIGPLFLVNAAAGLVIAVAVCARPHPIALASGVLFALGTLAAFFASVAVGLFGYHETLHGGWQESAAVVEVGAAVALAAALALERSACPGRLRQPPSSRAPTR